MNKKDLDRLNELKVHVWSCYVKKILMGFEDLNLSSSDIESHGGRFFRALRLLTDAGIVIETTTTDSDGDTSTVYKVLQIEESKAYAVRPSFTTNYEGDIISKVYRQISEKYFKFREVGYKGITEFKKAEVLYLYHHRDEFDIISYKEPTGYDSNFQNTTCYYLKDQLVHRNKMILKSLVELELMFNFTQYLQMYVGYDKSVVSSTPEETFKFNKYAISTVFLNNKLDSIYEEYEKETNKVNAMLGALNMTKGWIIKVGGYPEAIEIIRKGIMDDFIKRIKRFKFCFHNDRFQGIETDRYFGLTEEDYMLEYATTFDYIKSLKDLFTYDTLYGDPALTGPGVFNLSFNDNGGYYYGSQNYMTPAKMEGFNEPKDKRAA
jgi:hypothetical protein